VGVNTDNPGDVQPHFDEGLTEAWWQLNELDRIEVVRAAMNGHIELINELLIKPALDYAQWEASNG